MASNYYPMVSSSPPPLDDGPSFEDDEEDEDEFEFGNFTSAAVDSTCIENVQAGSNSIDVSNAENVQDSVTNQSQLPRIDVSYCESVKDSNDVNFQTTEHSDPVGHDDGSNSPTELITNEGFGDQNEKTVTDSEGEIPVSEDTVSQSHPPSIDVSYCESAEDSNDVNFQTDEQSDAVGHDDGSNSPVDLIPKVPQKTVTDSEGEIPVSEDTISVNIRASDEFIIGCPKDETVTDSEMEIASFEDAVSENIPGSHDRGIAAVDDDAARLTDEDSLTGAESDGNLCLGRGTTLVEHITDLEGRGSGVSTPLRGEESEVPLPLAPTECLEDLGDRAHSDSSFDDFTDFQTAPVSDFPIADDPIESAWTERVESDDEFDNFATFDGCEATGLALEVEAPTSTSFFEEDEFGTFNSATSNRISEKFADANVPVTISTLLASAFPDSTTVDRAMVNVKHLDEALRCAAVDDPKTLKSLWSHLHDIDNTHALTYHWSQSQSNKKLLHSLRIDARNFLAGTKWNSSMPLFAATLGSDPLEPKKATLPSGDEENPKSLVAGDISTLKFGGTQETAVPPAQFDWGSSGLVNPLDGLESEFLGSSSTPEGTLTAPNGSNAGPSLLVDKILSQAAKSSSATFFNAHNRRRASNLSQEATRVLDTLPDLSFMRAKVLMFPIRGAL